MLRRRLRLHAATTLRARRFSAAPKLKPLPGHKTLQILESTTAFLPQALAHDSQQLRLWDALLTTAIADTRSSHSRPVRVVVWGSNREATFDLVTALLEQPFASESDRNAIRTRWDTAQPHQTNLTLNLQSNAALPVQIVETRDLALLSTADVAIVLTRLADVHALNVPRADLVVVNTDEPEMDSSSAPRASTSRLPQQPQYFFASPAGAVKSLSSMEKSIEHYQMGFTASGMPALLSEFHELLRSLDSTSLQARTARSALEACRVALQDTRTELDRTASAISDLRADMEQERVKVDVDVLGREDAHIVDRAVQDATVYVKAKIEHMRRWYRAMWTIDEVTVTMSHIVQRVWRNDLEKELVFHSGRLEQLQRTFTHRAFDLISKSKTGTLHSSILENSMRQQVDAPTFHITPSSLTAPLAKRTARIIEAPTARLHVAGQRALFGMGGSIVTGMTISWTGYLGFFMNTNGLMSSLALEPGTAVGTGMLMSVLGIHWAARRWNKALKSWMDDFVRIAGGIKQDVTVALKETMENHVLVVAQTGCDGLSERISAKKAELAELEDRLEALLAAVHSLERK
uniref:Mmc1 C-terminal domain-containing protein n=1 Tax=Mycena chlorophos TaxID=658473 RepID=A0ABQ0LQ21_MYCCL|nr:predicted protein [Mycena chlorophos]